MLRWLPADVSARLAILACGAALLAAIPASAIPLNFDFGSGLGAASPSSSFGAGSGQTGVWNNITAFNTPSGIVDLAGGATGVSISITAASMTGSFGLPPSDGGALMQDNFYANPGLAWVVSISGLTDGLYDVYLYDPHNEFVSTGSGNVNGGTFAEVNGNFYLGIFSGENTRLVPGVSVVGGTLVATGISASWSGLAGMQIVPAAVIPEPATAALLGLGLAGLAAAHRWSGSAP